ncbi:Melamine deaminase [compost metagenome]
MPASEALRMATEYGAKSIFLDQIGKLAPGMKADFIALDIDQPHLLPHTDLVSHAVYSASAKDVEHVWVDGKQVVKHGLCLTLDEEEVRRKAQEAFEGLLKR